MKKENGFISEEYVYAMKCLWGNKNITYDYKKDTEKYRNVSGLKGMEFFYDVIAERKVKTDKPVVGYFCNTVPEEIIMAAGAVPLRLCNQDIQCAEAGEEIISGDICPVIKAICGGLQNDIKTDLLVIPATCDGKVKLAEILSSIFGNIYFIDIPRNSDYTKNIDLWESAYLKFYEYMKDRFKVKISRKELLSACKITNERTSIFRKIYKLRAEKKGIINAFDYFTLTSASFLLTATDWTKYTEVLYNELLNREIKTNYKKQILLAGSPIVFPNFKLLEIMEEAGCYIAADTLCSSYGHLFDPVEIDEETEPGIIRTLTLKYIAPSICPCFLGIDKLINAVIENVEKYGLDGVIYYNLRLCNVFEMEIPIIRSVLKDKGIPFLSLKTDFSREDTGQLKTRIEAFMEMLG
ncbi:MAG: 2-hydroxyacyl-CoA dehydratase family protein [Candidatus Omnitrophica bacterium]|nr:2-hydroxyacyl-CoA dehydratase family protein [Candidatus Omnitrophota bacterium]